MCIRDRLSSVTQSGEFVNAASRTNYYDTKNSSPAACTRRRARPDHSRTHLYTDVYKRQQPECSQLPHPAGLTVPDKRSVGLTCDA